MAATGSVPGAAAAAVAAAADRSDRAGPTRAAPSTADIASGVSTLSLRTRTADDIQADIERAEARLAKAELKMEKYEAIADDPSRTPEERRDAKTVFMSTIDVIKHIHGELNSLRQEMLALSSSSTARASHPPPQQPAPPIFGTLEELIVAMGGEVVTHGEQG